MMKDSFYLQITEYLPLQDVPIYEIESFTSQPSHLQGVDNSVCALEWLKSREVVPVLKSQRLVKPKQKGTKMYAKDIKSLIKKFAKLDIKSECKALVVRRNKSRAIVVKRKGSRAVVVRKNGSGALVKNKPTKPKLRAWVDLDDESLRIMEVNRLKKQIMIKRSGGKDTEMYFVEGLTRLLPKCILFKVHTYVFLQTRDF